MGAERKSQSSASPLPPFLPSSPHICVPAVTSEALFLWGKSV